MKIWIGSVGKLHAVYDESLQIESLRIVGLFIASRRSFKFYNRWYARNCCVKLCRLEDILFAEKEYRSYKEKLDLQMIEELRKKCRSEEKSFQWKINRAISLHKNYMSWSENTWVDWREPTKADAQDLMRCQACKASDIDYISSMICNCCGHAICWHCGICWCSVKKSKKGFSEFFSEHLWLMSEKLNLHE